MATTMRYYGLPLPAENSFDAHHRVSVSAGGACPSWWYILCSFCPLFLPSPPLLSPLRSSSFLSSPLFLFSLLLLTPLSSAHPSLLSVFSLSSLSLSSCLLLFSPFFSLAFLLLYLSPLCFCVHSKPSTFKLPLLIHSNTFTTTTKLTSTLSWGGNCKYKNSWMTQDMPCQCQHQDKKIPWTLSSLKKTCKRQPTCTEK